MTSIATDIKNLIVDRLHRSSDSEILRIASGLAANEQLVAAPAPPVIASRFVNLDANCKPVDIGVEHVAVYDRLQDLIFTRAKLPGEANYDESQKKCTDLRLFGRTDWRANSAHERFSINDLTKRGPALDTRHFAKESGLEWTNTPFVNADGSPSGCAWYVFLVDGDADWSLQGIRSGVRAVCAGQQLAFRL